MFEELINDYEYKELVEDHLSDLIRFLLNTNRSFNIVTNILGVSFDPILPTSLSENFKPLTMFAISGYTSKTAYVENNHIYFEAGFGPANFVSLVKVPLFTIMQVVIDDNVLFVNMLAGNEKFLKELDKKRVYSKSTNAFLSNPNNKHLVDKLLD